MADPLFGFKLAQQGINLAPGALETAQKISSPSRVGATPAPKARSLSDIKSKILKPALTSYYECFFNPPGAVRTWASEKQSAGAGAEYDQDLLTISCSEASLPGSSLSTIEINNDYSGVTERHAYRRLYDDRIDFTFYVDRDYKVIRFFENWISYIVDEQISDDKNGVGIESPNYFYRVNYPEKYKSPAIYVNKFEKDISGVLLQYKFLEAYPISISSMPVSYDTPSILKCTISFTYSRYFMVNKIVQSSSDPFTNPQFGVDTTGQFGQSGFNITRQPLSTPLPGLAVGGPPPESYGDLVTPRLSTPSQPTSTQRRQNPYL